MTHTEPGSTREVGARSGQGAAASSRPAAGQGSRAGAGEAPTRPIPPAAHYLFALLITLIVTGLAFPIQDAGEKWVVFAVGVLMDVSILIAWAFDPSRRRVSR
jgi:hypothetical protein